MSKTLGGITRTIALIVMIVCACIADFILYFKGQVIWGLFWSIIIGLVGVFEIVSYVTDKETISTKWKKWAEKSPFWAYLTLILLWVSLNALILHLAVY